MTRKQQDSVLLYISMGAFLVMSASFLLMSTQSTGLLPGIMFWGGLVVGSVLQLLLEARRRSFFAAYQVKRQTMQKPRNGLLTFCSNRYAVFADYALAGSALGTVLAFVLTKGAGYVCYVFISITVFLLSMHCILNGRIFFHVMNQNKVRQVLEHKKARNLEKGEGKK